ncbi:MAG: exonuclease SbcCD subunit D [Desulfurococcales archaeon]|nr:exonuclease SbcCD subunit D [Desulfurococcales archaeon]
MLVAHMSDLHIGAKPYGLQERARDVEEAFLESIERIERERPGIVVVAGDVFDKPKPDMRSLKLAVSGFGRLTRKGIKVVCAHGEHDTPASKREATPIEVLAESLGQNFIAPRHPADKSGSLAEWLRNYVVKVDGLHVAVFPFTKWGGLREKRVHGGRILEVMSRIVEKIDGKKLFLGHFSLEPVFRLDSLAHPDQLPPVDYAAMGHIHRRYVRRGGDCSSCPLFAYPGSLEAVTDPDHDEGLARRGFFLVDLSARGEPVLQDVWLDSTRPAITLKVESRSGFSELKRLLYRELERTLSRVKGFKKQAFVRLRIEVAKRFYASPRQVRELVEEASRKLGILPWVTVSFLDEPQPKARASSGQFDQAELIASIAGLERDFGEMVLQLKEAVLEGDPDLIDGLVDSIARKYGRKLLSGATTRGGGLSSWL